MSVSLLARVSFDGCHTHPPSLHIHTHTHPQIVSVRAVKEYCNLGVGSTDVTLRVLEERAGGKWWEEEEEEKGEGEGRDLNC